MANKAINVFLLFVIAGITFFSPNSAYSQKEAYAELPPTIVNYIEPSSLGMDLGILNMSDGNNSSEWTTIYEEVSGNPKMIFSGDTTGSDETPELIAYNFLLENNDIFNFRDIDRDLAWWRTISSPGTTHVIYEHNINGIPVFDSTVGVHIDNFGRVELVTNDYKGHIIVKRTELDEINSDDAIEIARANLPRNATPGKPRYEEGYFNTGAELTKVWRVYYPSTEPLAKWVFDIDTHSGAIYRMINTIKFISVINATGFIYSPNPYTSSKREEGLLTKILDPFPYSLFKLEGLYFKVINSTFGSALEINPLFDYEYVFDLAAQDESLLSNPHFEEVMVYYHLEKFRSYYKSLEFQLFNSYRITADAHGLPNDASMYDSEEKRIILGDGGVNDASDADIILHELGHATVDFIKPGLIYLTGETAAMHEGYSDYFPASFFDDPCIGEWDSRFYLERECLRRTDLDKHYPADLKGSDHEKGELWSAMLWGIREMLREIFRKKGEEEKGIDMANKLILKSIYYLPDSGVTFKEGAIALLIAGTNLYKGKYNRKIKEIFRNRGIELEQSH